MTPESLRAAINQRAEGYQTEIEYTFGYYSRTNPLHMRLAFLRSGVEPPSITTACELGFGQGVSLALHAAAGTAHWIGTDLNPGHVRHARSLAEAAGLPLTLYDDTFVDFAARHDIPELDFVVAHGIWSWVSDTNRRAILDFLRRRLRPGGVLYISYNSLPGHAAFEPVRHLMAEYASRLPGRIGIATRIDRSLEFADTVFATKPAYVQDAPRIVETLKGLRNADHRYLAHEYFNRDWRPTHFAEVASSLASAGLAFVNGGYGVPDQCVLLDTAQQDLLDGIKDPLLHETVGDFLLNRKFRYDYWVKPPVPRLESPEKAIGNEEFILVTDRPALPFEILAPLKLLRRQPDAAIVDATLQAMADARPWSLSALKAMLPGRPSLSSVAEAIILLLNHGLAAAVQPAAATTFARPATDRLNAHLLKRALAGSEIQHLASPILGGGVSVSLLDQIFLQAQRTGSSEPRDLVDTAKTALQSQTEAPEFQQNTPDLMTLAGEFVRYRLPILRSLMIT